MRRAWWVLGVLMLASVTVCAAQPHTGDDERRAAPDEDRSEYLERRGFYRRRAAGHGWFLTRSDSEVLHSRRLSDVLRTVPGVNTMDQVGGARVSSNRRSGACPMAVFVDGTYTSIRNVDELALDDIEGLEVYRGPAEVPLAYTAPTYEGTCGAILVWSRMELREE